MKVLALARAVAGLLTRAGWLAGLVILEGLLLAGFWASGPTPFGDAFDRRAAEADFLLLTLSSLPALFAGALLAAGDREDGMADFYRSCRISPLRQVIGTGGGLFTVTGGALVVALPASLALVAPGTLGSWSWGLSLVLALASTLVHGLWGLALGSWVHSRWAAVALAMAFWVVSVFALEALVSALIPLLPGRWSVALILGFTALDPTELVRVISVAARGQSWAYGPAFAEIREVGVVGAALLGFLLALVHTLVPGALAVTAWNRRSR